MTLGGDVERIEALNVRRNYCDAEIGRLCDELMRFPWPWRWAEQRRQRQELDALWAESERVYAELRMLAWTVGR